MKIHVFDYPIVVGRLLFREPRKYPHKPYIARMQSHGRVYLHSNFRGGLRKMHAF